jgi:hypothetical protein
MNLDLVYACSLLASVLSRHLPSQLCTRQLLTLKRDIDFLSASSTHQGIKRSI